MVHQKCAHVQDKSVGSPSPFEFEEIVNMQHSGENEKSKVRETSPGQVKKDPEVPQTKPVIFKGANAACCASGSDLEQSG
jgi:hypothetical protein